MRAIPWPFPPSSTIAPEPHRPPPLASFPPILAFLAATGCVLGTPDTGPDDTDGDADADTDSDTDTDDCDPLDPDPVPGPDCLAGSLECGSSITATTVGGSDILDEGLYEAAFCFIPSASYGGSERVYAFPLPPDTVATLVLDSPCADLDLVVVRWEDADRCPRSNSLVGACDADTSAGGGALEDLWGSSHAETRYLVVVDGKDDAEHNFTLSVHCTGR